MSLCLTVSETAGAVRDRYIEAKRAAMPGLKIYTELEVRSEILRRLLNCRAPGDGSDALVLNPLRDARSDANPLAWLGVDVGSTRVVARIP